MHALLVLHSHTVRDILFAGDIRVLNLVTSWPGLMDRHLRWLVQQAVSGGSEDEKLSCLTLDKDHALFTAMDDLERRDEIEVLYELAVNPKSGTAACPQLNAVCQC